jgi:hypothetical protein
MPNQIVYIATTPSQVHECAYSLLKHLDVYNLKPPADQLVLVYTTEPAMLEAYGSFFNHFDLKQVKGNGGLPQFQSILDEHPGNFLYLDTHVYPVREIEPIFCDMGKGKLFLKKKQGTEGLGFSILGLNAVQRVPVQSLLSGKNYESAEECLAAYEDLREFNLLLRDFFKKYQVESVPNQVKLLHHVDAQKIQEQKRKYQNLPFHQRVLRKLTGKGWRIVDYAVK